MKIQALGEAMVAEVDEIREAQIVHVRPGDLLALITHEQMSERSIARLTDELRPAIPEGVRVVVLEQMHFEVIRAEETP